MKKIYAIIIFLAVCIFTAACSSEKTSPPLTENEGIQQELSDTGLSTSIEDNPQKEETESEEEIKMNIQIGDVMLTATLEESETVDALKQLLEKEPITIDFSQYGGFEQVGSIRTSLPQNDKQINTSAGDIVLYSGNQMVIFYDSHSWSYTRIGKIDGMSKSELEKLLGKDDVTAILSIKE